MGVAGTAMGAGTEMGGRHRDGWPAPRWVAGTAVVGAARV